MQLAKPPLGGGGGALHFSIKSRHRELRTVFMDNQDESFFLKYIYISKFSFYSLVAFKSLRTISKARAQILRVFAPGAG